MDGHAFHRAGLDDRQLDASRPGDSPHADAFQTWWPRSAKKIFPSACAAADAKTPSADLIYEINSLAIRLQQQKVSALEATALLKKVMMEIDVAVFTFDQQQRLRIVNRAGEQLMGRIAPRMLGLTAEEVGLKEFLQSPGPQTVQMTFPGKHGRWAISHTEFRENGVPHQLLIISDLSRALREEERQAWQRLIRVLGHELNNSLAPIKSIAGTLGSLTARAALPEDVAQDMNQGLRVIENRVESLNRFMQAYTRLARMPAPTRSRIDIGSTGAARRIA